MTRLGIAICACALSVSANYCYAAPLDLSSFVLENYVSLNGPQNWVVGGSGNTQVTQTTNGDPAIFRSGNNIDVAGKIITGNFVITGADDDMAGFAFGYQNRGQMYLFGWKERTQDTSLVGMSILRLDTGSADMDPGILDFANTGEDTDAKTVLAQNGIPWERNINYTFELRFGAGQFAIEIADEVSAIAAFSILDNTFNGGDFGFFNNSQAGVTYSNLEVRSTNVIPLPASLLLLITALTGLFTIKRFKRDAAL